MSPLIATDAERNLSETGGARKQTLDQSKQKRERVVSDVDTLSELIVDKTKDKIRLDKIRPMLNAMY